MTERGFCACGCGERTSIAKTTVRTRNMVKGEPMRFVRGHTLRKSAGIRHSGNSKTLHFTDEQLADMAALYRHGWSCDQLAVQFGCLSGSIQTRLVKMGVTMRPKKRWRHKVSIHSSGYIKWGGTYVHRIVAEGMLERPLRPGEQVHHIDGDKTNNHPDNLQVFASASEHIRAERWRFKWTPEMEALLAQRRAEGVTAREIAVELGVSRHAVSTHAAVLIAAGKITRVGPNRSLSACAEATARAWRERQGEAA